MASSAAESLWTRERLAILMDEVDRLVKDNLSPEQPTGRGKFTPSENFNSNLQTGTELIDDLLRAAQQSSSDKEEMMREVNKQLSAVLGVVGNVHWALAGLSLISHIVVQLETMSDNKKLAFEIMADLVWLWRSIVQPLLDHEHHLIQSHVCEKGNSIIARAILFCLDLTNSSRISRFFRGGADKKKLTKFKEDVNQFRGEITAAVTVNIDHKVTALIDETRCVPGPSRLASLPRSVLSNPVGLKERVADVMESMKLEEKGKVIAIVLRGMGGIGKSTLADAVYDKVKPHFAKRSSIVLGQFPTMQHIRDEQCKLMKDLNSEMRDKNEIQGCKSMRDRMGYELRQVSEPFFLFIDNVIDSNNLEDFLPEDFEDLMLSKGSRLMVTTRDKGVCEKVLARNTRIQVVDIEVPLLSLEEGKKLLCLHTFQSPEPPPHFSHVTLVTELVEACGHLPLAIRVVGRQLRGEAEAKWRFAIQEIKKGSSNIDGKADRVFTVLKYSYDQLERQDYKEAFLMVTTLFVGDSWSKACKIVEGMWGNPSENRGSSPILESLVDLALIEREENTRLKAHNVKVHDLLVALGQKMANTFSTTMQNWQEKPAEYWRSIRWLKVDRKVEPGPASIGRNYWPMLKSTLEACFDNLEVYVSPSCHFGYRFQCEAASSSAPPKHLKVFLVDSLDCQMQQEWPSDESDREDYYHLYGGGSPWNYRHDATPPWPTDRRNIIYEEKRTAEGMEISWFAVLRR